MSRTELAEELLVQAMRSYMAEMGVGGLMHVVHAACLSRLSDLNFFGAPSGGTRLSEEAVRVQAVKLKTQQLAELFDYGETYVNYER